MFIKGSRLYRIGAAIFPALLLNTFKAPRRLRTSADSGTAPYPPSHTFGDCGARAQPARSRTAKMAHSGRDLVFRFSRGNSSVVRPPWSHPTICPCRRGDESRSDHSPRESVDLLGLVSTRSSHRDILLTLESAYRSYRLNRTHAWGECGAQHGHNHATLRSGSECTFTALLDSLG